MPLLFAAPVLIGLVLRELRWRRRLLDWDVSEGIMLRMERPPDGDERDRQPVIAYELHGQAREQMCEFNLTAPAVGEVVPIVVDPETGEIFAARLTDRWALTAILIICLLFLGFLFLLPD